MPTSYRNVARDEIDMLLAASFVCHVLRATVVAKPRQTSSLEAGNHFSSLCQRGHRQPALLFRQ
jgi:hypothetical protein